MRKFKLRGLNARASVTAAALAALVSCSNAYGQVAAYDFQLISLVDIEHIDDAGHSAARFANLPIGATGIAGESSRYNGTTINLGQSAWYFDRIQSQTYRLGFTDNEHTYSSLGKAENDYKFSSINFISNQGLVTGRSERYVQAPGQRQSLGFSGWLFDAATSTTTRLGLVDDEHTYNHPGSVQDGYRASGAGFITSSGKLIGVSQRYNDARSSNASLGDTAWIYDPANHSTTRLGFEDDEHTYTNTSSTSNDLKESFAHAINSAGQVLGVSVRYCDSDSSIPLYFGETRWLYDSNTGYTTRIGLLDAEHTYYNESSTRNRMTNTLAQALTDSGKVLGASDRYNSTLNFPTDLGRTIWIYDSHSGLTKRVGLTDDEHTYTNSLSIQSDYKFSSSYLINNAGQAVGSSTRYKNSSTVLKSIGSSAWFFDPTTNTTTKIGLIDDEHTYTSPGSPEDNYRLSEAWDVNEAGQVVGTSQRYRDASSSTAINLGQSAWYFNPLTKVTSKLGLTDDQHTYTNALSTQSDFKFSEVTVVDESGHAYGRSRRYSDAQATLTDLGVSAWVYDTSTNVTTRLGLVDDLHTYNNPSSSRTGYQFTRVQANQFGQCVGYSERYDDTSNSGIAAGATTWFFDSATKVLTPLVFSLAPDGVSSTTSIESLGDNGLVLGTYLKYNGQASPQERAFYWSSSEGFFGLTNQISSGTPPDVLHLKSAEVMADGIIYGRAQRAEGDLAIYALKPSIVKWDGGTGPLDGTWQNATDWAGDVMPRGPNNIVFNSAGSFSVGVTFDAAARSANVINNTKLSLNLNGHELALSDELHIGDINGVPAILRVKNGTLSASAVTVFNHGLLGGNATVAAPISIRTGGTVAPGSSFGQLNFTDALDIDPGAILMMEIGGTGSTPGAAGINFDQLLLSGKNLLYNLDDLKLQLTLLDGVVAGQQYTILQTTNGAILTGAFDGLPEDGAQYAFGNYRYLIDYAPGYVNLTFTTVPEPSLFALLALSGCFWRRKR